MFDVSKFHILISNRQMLIILLFHYSSIAIVVSFHLASEMLLSAGYMTKTEWKVSLGVMAGIGPFLLCDHVLIYSVNLAMCF